MTPSSAPTADPAARESGGPPALEVRGLTMQYPGVLALDGVSLTVERGEVRALLGKNGAGKSTLVKILSGAIVPDSGEVYVDGALADLRTPSQASGLGIQTVHQELSLVPDMTVAENIALGSWAAVRGRLGMLDRAAIDRRAREVLASLEVSIDPEQTVRRLSMADRQVVEIAKALAHKPAVLILDEPTSSLPSDEVEVLLALIRRLARNGISVIYVSHRMQEIPQVADSVTVLRDGRLIDTVPIADAPTARIVDLMTGGAVEFSRAEVRDRTDRPVVLSVDRLELRPRVRDVSFQLHEGEILGIAGLLGSGRTEILRCIFGLDEPDSGTITVSGTSMRRRSPGGMVRAGIGMTPEDRKSEGLALGLSSSANIVMAALRRIRRGIVLSRTREDALSMEIIRSLGIKITSPDTIVGTLSGGNQQKVLVGRWLAARARILLMDEPTRGVDIHAKEQFYALARELADSGISVIVVSSEVEELPAMCDRIVVLHEGRVAASMFADEVTIDELMTITMEGRNR